jgi:hypothetical protein
MENEIEEKSRTVTQREPFLLTEYNGMDAVRISENTWCRSGCKK